MIWITSDLHFYHSQPFLYEPRGFASVNEMNDYIVKVWNETVNEGDEVYILGDLMLNDTEKGLELLSQLNGTKYIILGNHDTAARIGRYTNIDNVHILGYATILKYHHYNFYLSHYPTITGNYDDDKPLKAKVINLCGHTHTKDKFCDMNKGIIYHCELDAHDNKPVSIDTIIEDIKEYLAQNK